MSEYFVILTYEENQVVLRLYNSTTFWVCVTFVYTCKNVTRCLKVDQSMNDFSTGTTLFHYSK